MDSELKPPRKKTTPRENPESTRGKRPRQSELPAAAERTDAIEPAVGGGVAAQAPVTPRQESVTNQDEQEKITNADEQDRIADK